MDTLQIISIVTNAATTLLAPLLAAWAMDHFLRSKLDLDPKNSISLYRRKNSWSLYMGPAALIVLNIYDLIHEVHSFLPLTRKTILSMCLDTLGIAIGVVLLLFFLALTLLRDLTELQRLAINLQRRLIPTIGNRIDSINSDADLREPR